MTQESKEEWLFHAERIAHEKIKEKKSCYIQKFICFTTQIRPPSFLFFTSREYSQLLWVPDFGLHNLHEIALSNPGKLFNLTFLDLSAVWGTFPLKPSLPPYRFSSFPYLLLAHPLLSNFEMMEFFKISYKASSLLPQNPMPGKSHQLLNF